MWLTVRALCNRRVGCYIFLLPVKSKAYFKTSTYPFAAATWSAVPPDLACRLSWIWPLLSHCRASLSMIRSSSFRAASISTPDERERETVNEAFEDYLLLMNKLWLLDQRMEEREHATLKVLVKENVRFTARLKCECLIHYFRFSIMITVKREPK